MNKHEKKGDLNARAAMLRETDAARSLVERHVNQRMPVFTFPTYFPKSPAPPALRLANNSYSHAISVAACSVLSLSGLLVYAHC